MKKVIFMVVCLMCLASCAKKEAVDNSNSAPADAAVKADADKKADDAKKADADKKADDAKPADVDKKDAPAKVDDAVKPAEVAPKADSQANPVA